jgi:hypothetical protein
LSAIPCIVTPRETRTPIAYHDWTLEPGADLEVTLPETFRGFVYVFSGAARVGEREKGEAKDARLGLGRGRVPEGDEHVRARGLREDAGREHCAGGGAGRGRGGCGQRAVEDERRHVRRELEVVARVIRRRGRPLQRPGEERPLGGPKHGPAQRRRRGESALAKARGRPFELHYGNLIDPLGLQAVIVRVKPDEIYNLASESHVGISFDEPEHSTSVNAVGVLRLLEIMRLTRPECRFYQASTSELFGGLALRPQATGQLSDCVCTETSPFEPVSPYAIAKQYAHSMTAFYRRGYGLHASNGILFNHESPRRGFNFVTRKITATLARIAGGPTKCSCSATSTAAATGATRPTTCGRCG